MFFDLCCDMYNDMKSKAKTNFLNVLYYSWMLETLVSMFEWRGLPETIPSEFLERYLIRGGVCGVGKVDGKLTAAVGGFCGNVDAYGIGTEFTASTPIGSFRGVRGESVAVGLNNSLMQPDFFLVKFADTFAELEKSIDLNIRYARLMPFPVVNNSVEKNAVDEVLKRLENGEMKNVIKIDSLVDPLTNEKREIPVLNLSDVSKIDKLQYLSLAMDDTIRRFGNIYGQSLQTTAKNRQALSDEIHGQDSLSFIVPCDKLKQRQKFADEINSIFGTEISVDFSECWKIEYEKFLKSNDERGVEDDVLSETATTVRDSGAESAD